MTLLQVDIDKKVYDNGTCSIENLAFSVQRGEFIAVIGPSGAGKTTLLKLIAGLDRQMQGRIAYDTGSAPSCVPKTSFMFQEPRLMPWLTVEQNLELVLPALEQPLPLPELLAQVGLKGCGQMFPDQLSGGMQRRVAMLRAFLVEPDLLLMDEPFQALDSPTAHQLRHLLHDLWQRTRPTVLFVTHNLREALSLADRILFLSARPARVILDFAVQLTGARALEDAVVQERHASLLAQHPQLLEGVISPESNEKLGSMAKNKHQSREYIHP